MTNQEILKIAMTQSAVDLCAEPLDFEKSENVVVIIARERWCEAVFETPVFLSACVIR